MNGKSCSQGYLNIYPECNLYFDEVIHGIQGSGEGECQFFNSLLFTFNIFFPFRGVGIECPDGPRSP